MQSRRISCFWALLLTCGLTGVADAAGDETAAKLDAYLRASTELQRFSGSVLVAREGQPILNRGYALADVEWQIANTPNTKFRTGSVTKQFTATAILLLEQDGKLRVRDPVCKYVPNCPSAWKPLTLHDVLIHSAGIPDYTEMPDFAQTQALPTTPEQLLSRFENKPLEFEPGSKFKYSNSGYVLLGYIIERASGMPYAKFLQERIFAPLKMADSGYDSNTQIIPRRASGYTRRGGELLNAPYIDMSVPYAAGAVYSTVEDLLKWDQALYATHLLHKESLQAMFTPYISIAGYGWAIDQQFGRRMISHNGMIDGFVSNIARYPDDKVTIIVLSNLDTAPIGVIAKDLAAIVFGQPYQMPAARHVIEMSSEQLRRYAGRYQVEVAHDITIEISPSPDGLQCKVQGQTFALQPESETTFSSEDAGANVVFEVPASGPINRLTFNGQFKATRVP